MDESGLSSRHHDHAEDIGVPIPALSRDMLSVTVANGEIFRVYPGDGPGRSVTVHQNAAPLDLSQEGADFPIAGTVQANLRSGVQRELVFGRNEPGLQHRRATWDRALAEQD